MLPASVETSDMVSELTESTMCEAWYGRCQWSCCHRPIQQTQLCHWAAYQYCAERQHPYRVSGLPAVRNALSQLLVLEMALLEVRSLDGCR